MYFLSIDLAINGLIIAGLAKTQVNITFVKWQHYSKGIPRIAQHINNMFNVLLLL